MLSKKLIAHIRSLKLKKFRDESGEFLVEGPKTVSELLKSGWEVRNIICTEEFYTEKRALINDTGTEMSIVSFSELKKASILSTPNKVLAIASYPTYYPNTKILNNRFLLALDQIRDPGNLGTIVRTADWFGVNQIVCSNDSADIFNPKVIQSTMGSFLRVRVSYTNLPEFISENDDYLVAGAFLEGESVYDFDESEKTILIVGNESQGISKEVQDMIGRRLTVPSPSGRTESLNAAIAASLIISEFARKRLLT